MLTWQFLQDLEYYASLGMAEPCFTLKGQGAFRGLYAEAGLGFTGSAYERVLQVMLQMFMERSNYGFQVY